jgi:hypothetical protein
MRETLSGPLGLTCNLKILTRLSVQPYLQSDMRKDLELLPGSEFKVRASFSALAAYPTWEQKARPYWLWEPFQSFPISRRILQPA